MEEGAHAQFSEDRHQLPESLVLERAMLVAWLTCAPLLSICCLTLCTPGTQSFVKSLSNKMTESVNSSLAERQWLAFKTASEGINKLYAGQTFCLKVAPELDPG